MSCLTSFWSWFTTSRPNQPKSDEEKIAEEIAEAFRTGEVKADLNSFGICSISVFWNGTKVEASWYSNKKPRGLVIGGEKLFPAKQSWVIFDAAIDRSRQLTAERIKTMGLKVNNAKI